MDNNSIILFSSFPDVMMLNIFRFLEVSDLTQRINLVSKKWNEFSKNEEIWREKTDDRFYLDISQASDLSQRIDFVPKWNEFSKNEEIWKKKTNGGFCSDAVTSMFIMTTNFNWKTVYKRLSALDAQEKLRRYWDCHDDN